MNYNYARRDGRRLPPFSLRLSFEERTKLERAAGDLPVASYIKSVLFGEIRISSAAHWSEGVATEPKLGGSLSRQRTYGTVPVSR